MNNAQDEGEGTMMPPSITNHYGTDHDRLEDLLKNFQKFKRTDFSRAKPYFRGFMFGLLRHIVWEEEILFPLFEEKTGMRESGPTSVMRQEHSQIKQHLEAIHQRVKRQDPGSDDEEKMLLHILSLHNQKEEQVLYPMLDRLISANEMVSIYKKMEAIPEERCKHCADDSPTQL